MNKKVKIIEKYTPLTVLLSVVFTYLFYKNNLLDLYFVVVIPMIVLLIMRILTVWGHRNQHNHKAYLLFHPTGFIKAGLLVVILLAFLLYFYAQCKAFALEFDINCVARIVGF